MKDYLKEQILAQTSVAAIEQCGFVHLGNHGLPYLVPCVNRSILPEQHFEIASKDYLSAVERKAVAFYHTHVHNPCIFSFADLQVAKILQLPAVLYSYQDFKMDVFYPECKKNDKRFVLGIWDCFGAVRHYYQNECKQMWPYIEHDFSIMRDGIPYAEIAKIVTENGLHFVQEAQPYDLFLMRIESADLNHCAIYLGGNRIYHQTMGAMPAFVEYNDYWKQRLAFIIRHD